MTDNVISIEKPDGYSPPPNGDGGDGGSNLVERVVRLETRMDYLATKEDLTKAVLGLKIWILSGVLGGMAVTAGIVIAIIRIWG